MDLRTYTWLDDFLKSLDARQDLEKIKRRLASLSPIEFFTFKNGQAVEDKRRAFVEGWKALQREFCKAVGPTGHSLEYSSVSEKQAWRQLGLHKHINKDGFEPLEWRREKK
jgi:hypothetical protein